MSWWRFPLKPELVELGRDTGGRFAEYRFELRSADQRVALRVVRRRRKTMAIYVGKDTVTELRVPLNCAWEDIERFLTSRFDWIVSAEKELASRPVAPANCYEPGGHIRFLGDAYSLEVTRSRFSVCQAEGDKLFLASPQPWSPAHVERQVLAWYRREAELLLPERVAALSELFPATATGPGAISIRKMKARWGSCASNGDLCFNLLLVQEGLSQIDFVVAHELCHLRHFAHNEAFYRLLSEVMPDWRLREERLGMAG